MSLAAARQVADAILYEGYLLYPYRATSGKNQVRWQFGVLGPIGADAGGAGEPPSMRVELLVEPTDAHPSVDLHVRFLHVLHRSVERRTEAGWDPVDELLVGDARWVPYDEATAREIVLAGVSLSQPSRHRLEAPGALDVEILTAAGKDVGRLVRRHDELHGSLTVTPRPGMPAPAPPGSAEGGRAVVLELRVDNDAEWTETQEEPGSRRDAASRRSFVSTHLLVTARGARLLSVVDPPPWAESLAASCGHERCWPVAVREDDGTEAVLVTPIILDDHPSVAPESPGDLFDATEIDEILTLRVRTLSTDERIEARGTDPRAAALLDRCEAMTADDLARLHGGRRDPELLPETVPELVPELVQGPMDDVPWWDPDVDGLTRPESDVAMVGDVPVSNGSRVLLRPSRRADAQDVFLAGLTARVTRVYLDVDGGTHLAVVLEDDPAADLYGQTGRFYYFAPDEVEPLAAGQARP